MTTTAQRLLTYLESRPELKLKQEGEGQYRLNSPLRPGSNSRGFTLKIEPDGEHGAFNDFAAHNGAGEKGSLYELAQALGIETGHRGATKPTTKRRYTGLADYAAAHHAPMEAFIAAGWQETIYINRPALKFTTKTGQRWRFTDGKEPPYLNKKGYKRCWYGLERAVKISQDTGQPLIICNGEASTITAQHYGLAAACVTSGEKSSLPKTLLTELQSVYTGKIIIAFDCDKKGRAAAPALVTHLQQAGFPARAVDLGGHNGFDLADFCGLHGEQAVDQLQRLKEIPTEQQITKKSAEYIAALKSLGYTFRLNILDDTVEVNQKPATDITAAELRTAMRDLGYTTGMSAIEDAYITEAARNKYHPIKDYLERLTWDGKDYISYLSSFFSDQQNIFALWLKKWLVGSVAKVYNKYQNPMLVLDGGQNIGKSHFASWLCPLPNHFMESGIQPDNNDHKIALITTWIWEVVELGATTRRADREALKAFVTLKDITVRKPYGRRPIHKPALASFIGTVNNESGFLNDPTGNRRFLTCTLTDINWDYAKKIDVSDVWAQAYHLYKTGFSYKLTSAEKERQAEVNEEYEVEEPLIAELLLYYQLTGDPDDFVPSREILIKLGFNHLDKRNTMRLSRAMKKHGVVKERRTTSQGREHGYIGLKSKSKHQ